MYRSIKKDTGYFTVAVIEGSLLSYFKHIGNLLNMKKNVFSVIITRIRITSHNSIIFTFNYH